MSERISDDELRRLVEHAYPQPWTFGESLSHDGSEWFGCGVTNADGHEFAWLETDPETDIPTARLIALAPALAAEVLQLREALTEIANITERKENKYPADWHEQIAACSECQRYKDHPIQQGICNDHRKPIYAQRVHDTHETRMLGYRAQSIARAALTGGHSNG